MKTMTINVFLQLFDDRVKHIIDEKFALAPNIIKEACIYALTGGKHIRPIATFLTADFLQINPISVLDFAISIEFIHSYSLIHDDLPCMDNDDFRRNQPTVHKKFGETIALLAGDTLLNTAYEILFDYIEANPDNIHSARLISQYAGINGMIGGQISEFLNTQPNLDDYFKIAINKTGGLFYASIMSVALLSTNSHKKNCLSNYAKSIGLIFQMVDDLLDKDNNETNSIVSIVGEERTKDIINRLCLDAKKSILSFENGKNLIEFCNIICKRNK